MGPGHPPTHAPQGQPAAAELAAQGGMDEHRVARGRRLRVCGRRRSSGRDAHPANAKTPTTSRHFTRSIPQPSRLEPPRASSRSNPGQHPKTSTAGTNAGATHLSVGGGRGDWRWRPSHRGACSGRPAAARTRRAAPRRRERSRAASVPSGFLRTCARRTCLIVPPGTSCSCHLRVGTSCLREVVDLLEVPVMGRDPVDQKRLPLVEPSF